MEMTYEEAMGYTLRQLEICAEDCRKAIAQKTPATAKLAVLAAAETIQSWIDFEDAARS